VIGVVAFVGVELSEEAVIFREGKELAGDGLGIRDVEVQARVVAEVVEAAGDGGWGEFAEEAHSGGDGGRGAVGVESSLDEERVWHGV
jgi:hypothetical protein